MEIAIYQVNMGRDHNRIAFQGFDGLERFQGTSEIDSEIYDKVFEGEVSCENLEDVYRMFNLDHPKGYFLYYAQYRDARWRDYRSQMARC